MPEDRCPECGARVPGGLEGCQAAWEEFSYKAYSDREYAALHDLAFDAYCMQHPQQYGKSPKSYAAHLARLCCGLEHNRDPAVYAAIRSWLDGRVELEKPPLLSERGRLTIVDVLAARSPQEHARLVEDWARDVWKAYAQQQALARNWIRIALEKM